MLDLHSQFRIMYRGKAQRFILALAPAMSYSQACLSIQLQLFISIKVITFIFIRKRFRKISTSYTLYLRNTE
jgi:hypothetical protein